MRKRLFILSFYIKLRKDITATVLKSASKARQYEPVIRRWGFFIKKEKKNSSCLSTIAVTETSLYSELMVSLLFPDAEIKQYGTQEECLEAVAN